MEYQSEGITAYQGDCLVESDKIGDGTVDLILTDLPYGTMNTDGGRKLGIDGWDLAIPPEKIYKLANRILRKNGKMVLFSQEPYTTELIKSAIPNVPFSYRAIWEKDCFANCLGARKNMVSYYEDILVFSKSSEAIPPHDFEGLHPLRGYFADVLEFVGVNKKTIINKIGQRADHCLRIDSTQFSLCTEKTYNQLIQVFHIDKMEGFRTFADLKAVKDKFKKSRQKKRIEYLKKHNDKYPSTFNLWEGKKYKSNILKYKKDYDGHHPTQKPVLLLEDLIKTFSNTGDMVVDLTAGSMSTGVACQNTGRKCTMIEMNDKYFKTGVKRLKENEHRIKTSLF